MEVWLSDHGELMYLSEPSTGSMLLAGSAIVLVLWLLKRMARGK